MATSPTRLRAHRDPSPRPRPASAPKPQLRVVTPLPRRRRRYGLIAGIVFFLTAQFALVLVHVELTAGAIQLTSMQRRGDDAQTTYEKLRLQVAQLESPSRIVADAQVLGMVTPTSIAYLNPTVVPSVAAPPEQPTQTQPSSSGPGVGTWSEAKRVDAGR